MAGRPAVHIAAVRRLGFVRFKFLMVGAVKRPILHQRTKFRKDRSNRCGYVAIFVIFFQDGGRRDLGFSKIQNFNCRSGARGNVRHHAKFHQDRSNGRRYLVI